MVSGSATKPEIFIGLVGAIGTDLDRVISALAASLSEAQYTTTPVRLSELLRALPKYKDLPTKFVDEYVEGHMKAGDDFRSQTRFQEAVALLGVGRIKDERARAGKKVGEVIYNRAYILRSLKNPVEVETLRRIYGSSFYLIAAYSPLHERRTHLAKRIAKSRSNFPFDKHFDVADRLIIRDQEDVGNINGQNTRDSFHRADVFVETADKEKLHKSIRRFVQLLLGHAFHTPTKAEYAAFHAHAASLRSSELGRQVGAAIATIDGDIVAVGCNEVPKAGGGLYWCGDDPERREFNEGMDGSEEQKRNLIAETFRILQSANWLEETKAKTGIDELVRLALDPMKPVLPKDSKIRSVIEFGRAVHGEMAALTDAARRGVSVEGCIMYVTTFPCHLCARHIVASGIRGLVYIEPYAKSLAAELYPDSIAVDNGRRAKNQVPFEPFVGIAPRQYMDLFSPLQRKSSDGSVIPFDPKDARPKFYQKPTVYLDNEITEFQALSTRMKEVGIISF